MEAYNGQDIIVSYDNYILLVSEGTGDNLLPEDKEAGFIDYFNLEVFNKPNVAEEKYDLDQIINSESVGGGFVMREHLIFNQFYGNPVDTVINAIFDMSGSDDLYDLHVNEKPEYKILQC